MSLKMSNLRLQLHLPGTNELTHCGLVTPYGDINLGPHWLSNGLLPDGSKPLPEPILTFHQ